MIVIGDYGVDWWLYLEGDIRRIVLFFDVINFNKWFKLKGNIIKLYFNF